MICNGQGAPDLYVIEGGAEVGARVVRGQVDLRGDALAMNVGVRVDTEACSQDIGMRVGSLCRD